MEVIAMSGTGGVHVGNRSVLGIRQRGNAFGLLRPNGQDKQSLLELARVWTQAALQERASTDNNDTATKAIAA